ncbi:MAG: tetratricopeptide repeat protein [Exilispira sp.]
MDEKLLELTKIIIDNTRSLFEMEKQKNNKDDILITLVSISRYLIDKNNFDLALSLLNYIEEKMTRTLRFYEEAIYLKMIIYERIKNKEEFEQTSEKIKLYPEFIIRKYNLLINYYYEIGEKEKLDKVFHDYEKLLKYDSLYKFIDYKLVQLDFLYRTAKYNELLYQLEEIEKNQLKECLSYESLYSIFLAGRFYSMKGLAYFAKESFNEALATLMKSVEYFKKSGFQSHLLTIYNNIGEIYKLFKKYDNANSIYEKIINTARYLGDIEAEAVATWNIGESYFYLKDYTNAEKYLTEGEKLFFESASYERYENYIKIFFARLYIETSRFESAEGLVDEVLMNAFEREEMKEYADALTLKGFLLGKKGEDVSHYFDEAIAIYKNLGAKIELKEAEKLKIQFLK